MAKKIILFFLIVLTVGLDRHADSQLCNLGHSAEFDVMRSCSARDCFWADDRYGNRAFGRLYHGFAFWPCARILYAHLYAGRLPGNDDFFKGTAG